MSALDWVVAMLIVCFVLDIIRMIRRRNDGI